ncbi:MAG: hypothetical protein R2865_12940 [Deinococcales bacterium]
MKLDRKSLQRDIHLLYDREHKALGEAGTLSHLSKGQELNHKYQLAKSLSQGGVLVFPHAGVHDCGYQIAACVQAALDSGTDKVLVISVLHAFSDEMEEARQRVATGGLPEKEVFWGIQGPQLQGSRPEWQGDHALKSWRYFWQAEVTRRGLKKPPQVIERYPYLAGGKPESLPGMAELAAIAKDAVIVSTADAFHHGIGYGDSPEQALYPQQGGLEKAKHTLEEGIGILEQGDYWGYNQHCVSAKSDARDAGQVFYHLRSPLKGRIVDLTYSDAAALYGSPPPTGWRCPFVWDKL